MPAAAVAAIFEEIMHSFRSICDRVAGRKSYTLGIPGDQPLFAFGPGGRSSLSQARPDSGNSIPLVYVDQ
jgi:hypothetical protein